MEKMGCKRGKMENTLGTKENKKEKKASKLVMLGCTLAM